VRWALEGVADNPKIQLYALAAVIEAGYLLSMSYEDLKHRKGARMVEIIVLAVAYLVIVNLVLPRFGIRFG
jgi:hypothetical protein